MNSIGMQRTCYFKNGGKLKLKIVSKIHIIPSVTGFWKVLLIESSQHDKIFGL